MSVITTRFLTKHYGKNIGISDVSFKVEEGDLFGFIGPNGAGKTTTMKTLLNFVRPTSGSATMLGMDVVKCSHLIKKQVGYVPGEVRLWGNLRAGDILDYAQAFHRTVDDAWKNDLILRFGVETRRKIMDLSLGNRKKVALVAALMHKPSLLLLDEPTNGLDPLMQHRLLETLKEMRDKGSTVFFSSHNLAEIQSFCTKVGFIKEGRLLSVGDVDADKRRRVTIKFSGVAPRNIPGKIVEHKINELSFLHQGDCSALLSYLSSINLQDVEVRPISLEEIFLYYYENGGDAR